MAGGAGAGDHGAGILQAATRTVHDHIKTAPLQLGQGRRIGAIPHQVLQPGRHRLAAPGEQGEAMAAGLQLRHQRFAHKARAAHHQNVHPCSGSAAEQTWRH